MRFLRFLTCVSCLMFLGGCVFLNIASQETAVPIHPSKTSVAISAGTSLDLDDTIYDPDDEFHEIDSALMENYKVGISLHRKLDLLLNMGITNGSGGGVPRTRKHQTQQYKAGLKYLIWQHDSSYYAIYPSLYQIKATNWDLDPDELKDEEYKIEGIETQFIYSYQAGEYLLGSLIARANLSKLSKKDFGVDMGERNILNFGGRANVQFSWRFIHQTTEIGLEVVPVKNGNLQFMPCYSIGIGMKL